MINFAEDIEDKIKKTDTWNSTKNMHSIDEWNER